MWEKRHLLGNVVKNGQMENSCKTGRLLFSFNFGNQRVREAKLLSDFIYYPEQAVREKICQDLVNLKGRKVLFVVDSFDQVNEQQLDGTVFQQLVDKDLLPNATLMVLSRSMESCHDNPLSI